MWRRWARRLVELGAWAAVLLVLATSVSCPAIGLDEPRLRLSVVSGTSMLPEYEPDDLLVTWRSRHYAAGDALVYRVPQGHVGAGVRVVHRVVRVNADRTYALQGDHNRGEDLWTPGDADVQGRVTLRLPRAGVVLRWMLSPVGLATATGVLVGASVWSWAAGGPTRGGGGPTRTTRPRGRRPRRRARSDAPLLRRRSTVAALATGLLVASTGPGAAATLGGVHPDDLFAVARPAHVSASPVTYTQVVTQDWTTGFCVALTVTNRSPVPQTWQVTIPMDPPFDSSTQPTSGQLRTVSWTRTAWVVRGPSNAPTLAPGASHTAQWCGTRTPPPVVPGDPRVAVAVRVTPAPNPSSSTCVDVDVTTTSPAFISWEAVIDRTTPGVTDPVLWLTSAPAFTTGAVVHAWDPALGKVTFRGNSTASSMVRADTPRTFRYCYPLNATAPLTDAPVTARVTSAWGTAGYCAEAVVTSTSTGWVRWRATVDRTTPGLTEPRSRLLRTPEAQGATTVSFADGAWVVRGVSHNQFVRAGSPATFTFCQADAPGS